MRRLGISMAYAKVVLCVFLLLLRFATYSQGNRNGKTRKNEIPEECKDYFRKGDSLFKMGIYEDAIKKYSLCDDLSSYKGDSKIFEKITKSRQCINYRETAKSLLQTGNKDGTIDILTLLLGVNPEDQAAKTQICDIVLGDVVARYRDDEYGQALQALRSKKASHCQLGFWEWLPDSCQYYILRHANGFSRTEVDREPEFGGDRKNGLASFIRNNSNKKNLRLPEGTVLRGKIGVTVRFLVDVTGEIRNPEIRKSVHPVLDAEAIRLFKIMPRWTPGIKKGKKVPVVLVTGVIFDLD